MSMRLLGVSEVKAALRKVEASIADASYDIVSESAATVEAAAKRNFEGSHKRGKPHVGGDRPNVVSGTLRRSIRHDVIRRGSFGSASTQVGPSTVYGRRVELGYAGSRGYPYFGPAVDETRDQLQEIAQRHWTAALMKVR